MAAEDWFPVGLAYWDDDDWFNYSQRNKMAKINGVVTAVYTKQFADGNEAHSIKVDGSPLYYRLGKKRYPGLVEKGNVVEFEYEVVDDKSAKVTGTVVAGKSAGKPAQSGASAAPASGGGVDWAAKDAAIQYQSARKDALEFVGILLTAEALKLPAKEGARVAPLEALVDKYTAQFFKDISTKGAIKRAGAEDDSPGEEAPAKKASIDEEDEE